MAVDRLLPTAEGADLVALVREFAQAELVPRAAAAETEARFPREIFLRLGELGMLAMPYPEEYGGLAQPYEIYLQAIEELAAGWMSVGVGVSVHVMSAFAMSHYGTARQRAEFLPPMLGGRTLGAYALSEAQAGSDISGMTTRAKRADEGYDLSGAKAWITHGSEADYYTTFARTSDDERTGISLLPRPR